MGDQENGGRTFYRVVATNPPARRDSLSHQDLGNPLRDESERELWSGVSVQSTKGQARQRAKLSGFGRYIAEIRVRDSGLFRWHRTGRQAGHHTVWGDPDDLLACVVRTVPV